MGSTENKYLKNINCLGHEVGLGISLKAASLGAAVIERHFTLDKTQKVKINIKTGELILIGVENNIYT